MVVNDAKKDFDRRSSEDGHEWNTLKSAIL
jgi:hypothetical protein